jgi:hypothetical protein
METGLVNSVLRLGDKRPQISKAASFENGLPSLSKLAAFEICGLLSPSLRTLFTNLH